MRTRNILLGIGALLVVLAVSSCSSLPLDRLSALLPRQASSASSRPTVVKVGALAPEINLKSMTGDQIVLSQLVGRPVLVNFWATWCGPCREEFPAIVRKYRQYQPQGFVVVGVNFQDDNSDNGVLTFMKDTLVNFPVVRDMDESVGRMYRINGLPTSIFIDRKGIVQDVVVGGPMTDAFLDQEFTKINQ